jgi:amidohydrolase
MDPKASARATIESHSEELRDISRWMFHNPEVAFQEHQTSAKLAHYLSSQGFNVEYPAYGLQTAFVARTGSSGPEIVICAEYDALPGVGQACGHNIIATSALGAGLALRDLAESLGIRVTVLGTPAEELYGGKVDLINAGAFSDASLAMMVHPSTHDVVDPTVISVVHLDVSFRGKSAHASSFPFSGINALDAFVQAYVNISTLRQQLETTDKVHGIITHGGDAANIIPDFTKSTWYVRAPHQERLDVLLPRIIACFEAAATATGCTMTFESMGHPFEVMRNNQLLVDLYGANSAAIGRPMLRGGDLPPHLSGSTDMGNVSKVVPSIHPMIGIDSLPASNHQPEFAAHTITPAGEKAIVDGAIGMAWTVIDVATGNRWSELKG